MKYFGLILLIFFPDYLFSVESPKSREDIWKAIHNYHNKFNPGLDVPRYPKYSTWVVTGESSGVVVYKEKVPVRTFDRLTGDSWISGYVPVGVEVTLTHVERYQRNLYYEVSSDRVEVTSPNSREFWINGHYIRRDKGRSWHPPKDFLKSPLLKRGQNSPGTASP